MPTHSETRPLPYTAQQMYDLVADVASYPQFLPWTAAARIKSTKEMGDHTVMDADLVRELDLPIEVDFLEASSYGDGMESTREVRILKDLRGGIEGRDVLLVEDIVDTGHTLHHVTGMLRARKPARLKTVALLDKPTRREVDLRADYTGFEIPDEFVVGYGIDFAQRNRNLPFIGKVRFTEEG